MNVKIISAVFALALAIIVALIICVLSRSPRCAQHQGIQVEHDDRSLLFSDLSNEELMTVKNYLKKHLNLVDISSAKPSDNYIYYIEVQLPKKRDVLMFLDQNAEKPNREALAVVIFGAQSQPNITEYIVGPLPNPIYHTDVTSEKYGSLDFNSRPFGLTEFSWINSEFIEKELAKASKMVKDSFDGNFFAALMSAPMGLTPGKRQSWFVFYRNLSGVYLHPTGLEILVDFSSVNISEWHVKKVLYNGKYFEKLEDLEDSYEKGTVEKTTFNNSDLNYGSLKPPHPPSGTAPLEYEPQGKRYSVKNNQVKSLLWSFSFGQNAATGLRLFDIRFNGERIIYELSIQEALSVYGSNTAGAMLTRYMDASFGIGKHSYELVRGVDCPYTATYLDSYRFFEASEPMRFKNSICIFEHNTAVPLRRHYASSHYGGLTNSVLIIRTIATIGNYDYVWDYMFYQNGAIEAKVHATGYIYAAYLFGDGLKYGTKVRTNTLGTIHTHFVHYKVDLDIVGTNNLFVTRDMDFEKINVPWDSDQQREIPRLIENLIKTEDQAAFALHSNSPRYLLFASNKTNDWGHRRSYRIQIVSFAGDHMPKTTSEEKGMSWGRFKMAVTKHKDEEPSSSSIHNQNNPWKPAVNFADFINNENIVEEDLVAWITTGFLHIPHSEDIPNTVTVGNGVGFLLRPYNYFKEDPSIYSPDAVFIDGEWDTNDCMFNPVACLSKTASCSPDLPPFTHHWFKEEVATFGN
ncbi:amine oxidase [copper-containing] 3-like [Latimeria chalumnae]|nr:PREDICTED: membrane primary amine oxidase-like [Latimeria chalumnae]XP_014350020.1 PREDICTED: membrane primary amine oxidase-like [Latimeria chalumnae]|eukprot:XP_006006014.1 PREDICTED: membrane primary amine oxidase-like [Latimeria chalumnae]